MAPYQWRRPFCLTYPHNLRYGTGLYYGALDDIERKYLYSVGGIRFPYDRYDYRFLSYPYSPLKSSGLYTPSSILWSTGDIHPRYTSNLYDPLPRMYTPPPRPRRARTPLRRSHSFSDLDDLIAAKEDTWAPLSSYLYPDGTSPLKRVPSVEDLAPRRRCRSPDLYDLDSKSSKLDPSLWTIWYNPILRRSPVMFRRRLAYFLK